MAKKIPLGVNIISILIIISAILSILFSVFSILVGVGLTTVGEDYGVVVDTLIYSVILGSLAILVLFIAFALRKGKNWARIILIVIYSISTVIGILSFSLIDIISVIIRLPIVLYLLLDKDAKRFFR